VIASLMARDVLHFLIGDKKVPSLGRRLVYDFTQGTMAIS